MSVKSKLLMMCAALALSTGMAQAITVDDVVTSYQNDAFTSIEVLENASQIKVEAIKDGVKLQIVYDKVSGNVLSKSQSKVTGADAGKTGVEVRSSSASDLLVSDGTMSGGGDDDNDHDSAGSGSDDDNGSDSSGSGHDSGESHSGGDNDSGSDHNGGGDDNGGGDHDSDGGNDNDNG